LSRPNFLYLFLVLLVLDAKAQSWVSIQWHNSVSHYNYYYNANELVKTAKEDVIAGYKDNYKDILSLYPMLEQNTLKGNASKMDEVLKKCSFVIDKHSKSKWVDDCYLLMGDAQLYKGDFYAAVEVYEYVAGMNNSKSATSAVNPSTQITAYQAQINILTTYLLMGKIDDAEALYTKLASKKELPAKLKPQLDMAGAAIMIKVKKFPQAIKLLELVLPTLKNKLQKVRVNFVLAQLYNSTKNNLKATEKYKKVVKLNPPYEFAFNAKLNMAKAINPKSKGEIKMAKTLLREMLKDDKNIDYNDQIFFELGQLEVLDNNPAAAIVEYGNCLRSKGSDMAIKSTAYMALADLYFKSQQYENAQVYYDSAARTVDTKHPDYQSIQAKNLVLNELIKHLVNIREKDSLLRLSDNEKLREKTIDKLIKNEKDRLEQEKQLQEQKKNQQIQIDNNNGMGTGTVSTNFPFYNMAAKTKGYQDFQRIWGNRELTDYWAISSNKTEVWKKIDEEQKNNDLGSEQKKSAMDKAPAERKKYYENIPFSKAEKQKMRNELAESYFLGANVYYQSLKELDKAKKLLEELNSKYPDNSFQINAWYLLARIYKDQKNDTKFTEYLDKIKQQDPNSVFLTVLMQKQSSDSTVASSLSVDEVVEQLYQKAYLAYKQKQFAQVLEAKKQNDTQYPGNPLQIQFDYLEALVLGEQGQLKPFQEKLQAIVDNYPGTAIAEQSEQTIHLIKIKTGEIKVDEVQNAKYKLDLQAEHFYMVLVPKQTDMTALKIAFINFNKSYFADEGLRVTTSLLGDQYQILIVNHFRQYDVAKKFFNQIKDNKAFFEEAKLSQTEHQYLISKDNFSILIGDKVLTDYQAFYQSNYKF